MMKTNKYIIVLISTALFSLTGCTDWLEQEPMSQVTTAVYFKNAEQFQNAANKLADECYGFGRNFTSNESFSIFFDYGTDLIGRSSDEISGLNGAPTSESYYEKSYKALRNINNLLDQSKNYTGTENIDQPVGQALFYRAFWHFFLLKRYGGITLATYAPETNSDMILAPRNSRYEVVQQILDDLDEAISRLKNTTKSSTGNNGQVTIEAANALKARVCLFEGTWEKYHKAKNDKFFDSTVPDEKIRDYFNQAVAAAKEVMDRGVWAIYNTGNKLDDYRQMFQTTDLSGNPEVLWYKQYDGDQIGNNVNRYLNQGGGSVGVTASLVDDYLTIDGKPFVGDERIEAKKVFGNELQPTLRDPRLSQTVCMPGQQLRPDDKAPYYVVPPLIGTSSYNQNMTGYSLLKHVQIDYTGSLDAEFKGATPAIQFRYADILLNYAEALAELDGVGNAQKIIDALQPLRDRVGMPPVDFDREYNQEADYGFRNLDKYIQAVRRERRVEKACEGRRQEDIMRWAAADELIVGKWPKGALFVGSNLENHPVYGDKLIYDQASGNNLFLTGKPGDPLRYIIPTNPAGYESGWKFNVNRDYLLPIQTRMLGDLTGGMWEQNPGW